MKNIITKSIVLLLSISTLSYANTKNYTHSKEVKKFIKNLSKMSAYNTKELNRLFSKVKKQNYSLKVYTSAKKNKKEKKKIVHGSWDRYEKYFLTQKRINLGAKFMKKNKKYLYQAYKKYSVPPEYIAAILGIETYYGKHRGKFPVFDSLVTLAFEKNRRNKFFKSELKQFLLLTKKQRLNPLKIKGSYAGAFGISQFMPSSFNNTAVDFDKNGIIDINKMPDAIGSVANYFYKSGWQKNIPTATRVSYKGKRFTKFKTGVKYKYKRYRLKNIKPKSKRFFYKDKVHLIKLDRKKYDELWYGTKNFYVITTYNRHDYYAMAVHQLAKKIKKQYLKLR